MSALDPLAVTGIPDFWERVRRAPHRLLGLDYDGTLAPFHVIREAAIPLPGTKDALAKLQEESSGTSVVLISGRPALQVRALLGPDLKIPIIGVHGWEFLPSDGHLKQRTPDIRQREGLARAWSLARTLGLERRLEIKISSIALHTREASGAADVTASLEELWWPLTQRYELAMLRFNGGLELRARGYDKGAAYAAYLATLPGDTLPVYIGDDTTDEDVFRRVRESGIGIRVGDGATPTDAAGHLADPAAVLRLLQLWPLAVEAAGDTEDSP